MTTLCDPDNPPLYSWEIEIDVSFIPSISIMSSPNGPYNPVALDSLAGPKAGVALIPCPYIMCRRSVGSDVAHVDAPESNIICPYIFIDFILCPILRDFNCFSIGSILVFSLISFDSIILSLSSDSFNFNPLA